MCRLLGIMANKEVDLRFSLVEGPHTLMGMSEWNPDGWGLGWYEDGQPVVVKEPQKAGKSKEFVRRAAEARSLIFVAHVRKGTTGAKSMENCHPFQWDRWLFAHNGSVNREDLLGLLSEEHHAAIRGKTDSEVYFHWILQNIEREGDAVKGIKVALREVRNLQHSGLNFILSNGERLYGYREASRNYDYYSLYWLNRDPREPRPIRFESKEVRALLESKSLNNERAILVCSEKLTQEEWVEIPLRHLLVVSSDLETECVEMD
ncbi:MAG: hypothetical protein KatS3mg110_4149 [Pirellulaceae bacterium]|nr:MAG: hypothetical protein KatS3mg110_4149 [Pirellulaceae bacterium]